MKLKDRIFYFFFDWGIPIISGVIGAFIGMTIARLLGIV